MCSSSTTYDMSSMRQSQKSIAWDKRCEWGYAVFTIGIAGRSASRVVAGVASCFLLFTIELESFLTPTRRQTQQSFANHKHWMGQIPFSSIIVCQHQLTAT